MSKSLKHASFVWLLLLSALLVLNFKACSTQLDESYAYDDMQNAQYQREFDEAIKNNPINDQ